MKRFRFRLKRLERLRDVRRLQARAVVAQALARVREVVRDREQRECALATSVSSDLPTSGPLDLAGIKALAEWREGLRRGVRHAAAVERQERERAREATARLALAARDHRVLERLRQRQHARWLRDADLEQQKFLDEVHRTTRPRVAGGDDA